MNGLGQVHDPVQQEGVRDLHEDPGHPSHVGQDHVDQGDRETSAAVHEEGRGRARQGMGEPR